MKIDAVEFVRSAAGAGDLPDAGLPELAMVGRSNVGKSTLINGLVKRPVARTSATPGKTRLLNVYRVLARPAGTFYLVDLPGYGYVRKEAAREEFDRLAQVYFARAEMSGSPAVRQSVGRSSRPPDLRTSGPPDHGAGRTPIGALLALDARHPGLENDLATARWLRTRGFGASAAEQAAPGTPGAPLFIVVTKIDKLARNERARTLDQFEQVFEQPVLAVSAVTGEGMDELWKQMVSWVVSMAARKRASRR